MLFLVHKFLDVFPEEKTRALLFQPLKGNLIGVAWTFPLTLLHQARACPFKSARLLYLIPTMKLSRTNYTVRSAFPFVWPRYGWHRMGLNP